MTVRGELHLTINQDIKTYPLDSPRFTFGRGNENSFCIQSTVVSRSHAELIRIGNDFLFRDLGSTNGSFINNVRITEQVLNDGDVIRFGNNGPEMSFRKMEQPTGDISKVQITEKNLIDSLTGQLKKQQDDVCDEVNLRSVLAEAHLNKGEIDKALEVLDKYGETSNLNLLPGGYKATVLLWLGRSYLENKQLDEALEALQNSLELYKNASDGDGDETGIASAHTSLGRTMIGLGDYLAANGHLQRAKRAARRAGNVKLRAEVHFLLGKIDWKEGDFEGASYNWERSARLAEESNDPHLKSRVQLQRALILYTEGKLKEALPAYKNAIQQIEATGNYRLLLKGYSGMSRVLTRLGSWTATANMFDERLRLAQLHKLSKAEALAHTDRAELHLLQGDHESAWISISQALNCHGKNIYARTQRILGRILVARNEETDAIDALERGLTAAHKRGAIEEQVLIGLELALIYVDRGETERARELVEIAEAATSLDPALNLMARALYTRGCIYKRDDMVNEANRSFSQSLSIFQSIGDPYRTALCHTEIGRLRFDRTRLSSARAHLEEAKDIFAKLGAIDKLQEIEKFLSTSLLSDVIAEMTTSLPGLGGTSNLLLINKKRTSSPPSSVESPIGIQRVLVAVSNDDLVKLLVRGLEVENYQVDRFRDGREASENAMSESGDYQLLIMDALLEHQSGFDICRELRKKKMDTPVILLGGRQGLEDKIEALQSGADDFLSKRNFIFEELLAKVEALLR